MECPHCHKEIQVSTKQLNKYGLVEGSKGDFICQLITIKGVTLIDLITKVDEKYPNKNNIARILRVINELKNKKVIYQKDNLFCLITLKNGS